MQVCRTKEREERDPATDCSFVRISAIEALFA